MRKLALAVSTALIATPVFAVQMEGNYLSSAGGIAMQPNITYHGSADTSETGHRYLATENKPGTSFDLAYGYQTEDLRAEVSAIYLQNKIKKSLMRSTYFDINGEPNNGSMKVMGLIANGMYDFNSEADFTPYIGFGVGFVRMTLNAKSFPSFSGTITTTGSSITVNDPPVTTTTTSGTTTTTTTTYTQTTTLTTTVTPAPANPAAGVTALPAITSTTVTVSSPPASTAFSSTFNSPGAPTVPAYAPPPVENLTNVPSYANGTHLQLGYQTIIGVSYKLTDYFKATADYRYLRALSTTFKVMNAGADVPMKGTYSNHRFTLGLTAFL